MLFPERQILGKFLSSKLNDFDKSRNSKEPKIQAVEVNSAFKPFSDIKNTDTDFIQRNFSILSNGLFAGGVVLLSREGIYENLNDQIVIGQIKTRNPFFLEVVLNCNPDHSPTLPSCRVWSNFNLLAISRQPLTIDNISSYGGSFKKPGGQNQTDSKLVILEDKREIKNLKVVFTLSDYSSIPNFLINQEISGLENL